MKINEKRFLENFRTQGRIGWRDGEGMFRAGFGEKFREVRAFMQKSMEEAGIPTRVDTLGNLFGLVEGENKNAILLSGSHLDSVTAGGKYDGALGAFAALEAALTLKESGYPLKHSFEVVGFNSEEGSELGGSFGSRGFCGMIDTCPPQQAMEQAGITWADIEQAKAPLDRYAGFVELHIEQGPVLDRKHISVGVPTAIFGITRYRCVVRGKSDHAGTTPMLERHDALYETMKAASAWMEQMRGEEGIVCNIGDIQVEPGHICVVPAKCEFVVELRSIRQEDIDRAVSRLREKLEQMETCTGELTPMIVKEAVCLDESLVDLIYHNACKVDPAAIKMVSGASHDASPLSHFMPAGMIFVPSADGISHAKEEFTKDSDLILGTQLLLDTILALDTALA